MDLDIMASVQEQDHRQLPVRARRRDGDADRLDDRQVPRRVRGPHRGRAGAQRAARPPTRRRRRRSSRGRRRSAAPRAADDHLLDRRARGHRARERDARRRRQVRRRRDPGLLLRAQARRAGRRLPHVPGRDRGHPEAADRAARRRSRTAWSSTPRPTRVQAGAGGGRRVPARQPPARLPGLRQGRRVPAAGHLLRLGRRALALHRAQAPLPEAARAQPADRDRPRALHPLLPLRALLAGDLRGLPAGPRGARRAHLRRHLRRPPLRRAVQRQHHRAVPGGRADLAALPLPRAPVGHRGRGLGLHAVPGAVQRHLHRARRPRPARARRATTPRSTTAGCATRAASPTRRSTSTSASRSR